MKKIKIKVKYIAVSVICIICSALIGVTMAKYIFTKEGTPVTELGDFNITYSITPNVEKDTKEQTYTMTYEEYKDFTLDVKYTGKGSAFMRVRVVEEWYGENDDGEFEKIVPSTLSEYNFGVDTTDTENGGVFDNRSVDGYLYIKKLFTVDDNGQTIHIITKAQKNQTHDTIETKQVKIHITIDTVQFNRYRELWNIDNLPFELSDDPFFKN